MYMVNSDTRYRVNGTHLLSGRVHNLIIHSSVHLPIARLQRVRREQVARRVRVHAVYLRIEDTRKLIWTRLPDEVTSVSKPAYGYPTQH